MKLIDFYLPKKGLREFLPGYPGSPDPNFSRLNDAGGGGAGGEDGSQQHLHRGQHTQQHQSRDNVPTR